MNSNPRQLKLLNTVRSRGSITVEQLAEMLDVTLQTVRRDVQRLADEGLLTRFHGGVRVPSSTTENIGYRQLTAVWRLQGLWAELRGTKHDWGVMTRVGFTQATTPEQVSS